MPLNEYLMGLAFGDRTIPDAYEFVLVRSDATVSGYPVPTVARSEIRMTGTNARTEVRFGPVTTPLEFDTVAMRADGEILDTWPVGQTTISPGMVFRFEPTWALEEA